MYLLISIVLALIILKFLIKWWIRFVDFIFDPVIKYYENKDPRLDVYDSKGYKNNIYITKHYRLFGNHKKAEELRESFRKGYEQLDKQYQDYLKWCSENNEKPIVDPPDTNRLKVNHLD